MTPMTSEQLAGIRTVLGFAVPAEPHAVLDALTAARRANRVEDRGARLVVVALPSLVRRLLDTEEAYAAVRSTIARLVVANHHGGDYNLGDLAFELQRAEIDLKDDYAVAEDLARAAGREGLL
ncbi:hypothetical protein [Streptomyces albicerus]|uniref:hypothetical protein n=1 Tax=Streptomyces albicerus TaxID=2569859 RepID=UPI00124B1B64|nr:hypothetical protein [Streptomyces albicerus]